MRPAAVAGAMTVCPSCVVPPYVCSAITHGHPPDGPAHLPSWEDTFPPANIPIIARCLRRVGTWRLPPNWSAPDWLEEVKEVLGVAALEAEADFDSARGVPFGAFLFHRGLARVLTRYRQEWNYGTRFSSECARRCAWGDEEPNPLEGRSPGTSRTACEAPSLRNLICRWKNWLRRLRVFPNPIASSSNSFFGKDARNPKPRGNLESASPPFQNACTPSWPRCAAGWLRKNKKRFWL
jgi:hypothetical protein